MFAYKESKAKWGELVIENQEIEHESFMIEKGDDIVIKATKKKIRCDILLTIKPFQKKEFCSNFRKLS